jgi:predicted N-acetyltransferase YhbS
VRAGDLIPTVRWETALTDADHAALCELLAAAFPHHRALFARQSWAWARKEARLWLADPAGQPLAHLAVERRLVDVGGREVLVAGVGEVAVHPRLHRGGLGAALMAELRPRLRAEFAAEFGFLQCGSQVAGFYQAVGWTPVTNPVRHLDPGDERTVRETTGPTLVIAGRRTVPDWPAGVVDLRGLPW